jgi:hypothetical protein
MSRDDHGLGTSGAMSIQPRHTSHGQATTATAQAQQLLDGLACPAARCPCQTARTRGHGTTHCPGSGHAPDRNPSLGVWISADGSLGLNCLAGRCDHRTITRALETSGLWSSARPRFGLAPPRSGSRSAPAARDAGDGTASPPPIAFVYRDATGAPVAVHIKEFTGPADPETGKAPKRYRWSTPNGGPGLGGLKVMDMPLYRLPELLTASADQPVLLCEGEPAADALAGLGFVATSLPGGAGQREFGAALAPLAGRPVVLVPDNDDPGHAFMAHLASVLDGVAASVRWLVLPGLPAKGDAVDFVRAGGVADQIRSLIEVAPAAAGVQAIVPADGPRTAAPAGRGPAPAKVLDEPKPSERIVAWAEATGEYFHDPGGRAYATVVVDDHHETYPLASDRFKLWLRRLAYEHGEGLVPRSEQVAEAVAHLTARAVFRGDVREVHIRVARADDAVYLDLGDPTWHVVEVTRNGWRVVPGADVPVRFRRAPGLGLLPRPVAGGSIDELWRFVNVVDADDRRLLVLALVAALSGIGPYPVLVLLGGQGTAKSTSARACTSLVDPSDLELRAPPRDERDIFIAATNGHLLAFDNLSIIPAWQSDALCRLATGGGFATRALYQNSEEARFNAMRPLILTAITEVVTRSDLLDRSIVLRLPPIADRHRQSEHEWRTTFADARGRLFGCLLDGVASYLQHRATIRLAALPRMADFALVAAAAAPAFGWMAEDVVTALSETRSHESAAAVEGSVMAQTLLNYMVTGWCGTAGELLQWLSDTVSDEVRKSRGWPVNPRVLSSQLRRLAPNLEAAGLRIEFDIREGRNRTRKLRITPAEVATTDITADPAMASPGASVASVASATVEAEPTARSSMRTQPATPDTPVAAGLDVRPRPMSVLEPERRPADATDATDAPSPVPAGSRIEIVIAAALELAELEGWPRLTYRPGYSITGGEAAWRQALASAGEVDLDRIRVALMSYVRQQVSEAAS